MQQTRFKTGVAHYNKSGRMYYYLMNGIFAGWPVCPVGKYGEFCNKTCIEFCEGECDFVTGRCYKCYPFRQGLFCNESKYNNILYSTWAYCFNCNDQLCNNWNTLRVLSPFYTSTLPYYHCWWVPALYANVFLLQLQLLLLIIIIIIVVVVVVTMTVYMKIMIMIYSAI